MELSTEIVLRILLAANVVLLGGASIALLRFREHSAQVQKFWNSPAGVSLADTQSLAAKKTESVVLPNNPALERKVAELTSTVRALANTKRTYPEATETQLPIENAVRMARHGASIEELIRSCGLNIGEAQLMRKLHGQAGAAVGVGKPN